MSVERCIFNRYMNCTMLFKVHVVSVERCIFNRYMNCTMLFKVHVVSVERCIFNRYMNGTLISCCECRKENDAFRANRLY